MLLYSSFLNDTATTEIYTLSLHDALPISVQAHRLGVLAVLGGAGPEQVERLDQHQVVGEAVFLESARQRLPCSSRSEEHTSELQSRQYLVCRLLLEKKKKNRMNI